MDPPNEEFPKRENERPDQWTLAWWNEQFAEVLKGYRGASHAVNRAIADYADTGATVQELQQRCDALNREATTDRAQLGKLQAELTTLRDRVNRIAEFLNKFRDEQKKGGGKDA